MSKMIFTREYNVRIHQSFEVEVTEEMLANPALFDANGSPTWEFDELVCGTSTCIDETTELLEDDDMNYNVSPAPTEAEIFADNMGVKA